MKKKKKTKAKGVKVKHAHLSDLQEQYNALISRFQDEILSNKINKDLKEELKEIYGKASKSEE